MAKINSRQKGARAEREIAQMLRDNGFDDARRGQQFSGANGDPDVVGLPRVHIEVKRVEKLNLDNAMEQSYNDSIQTGTVPTVFHRKNGKDWKVTMYFDDWMRMYKSWLDGDESEESDG